MKISGFLIEGVLNICSLKLNLENFNALIAPNGYGKSNVLDAISFGIQFLSASEQGKAQMMRSRYVPINANMYRQNFRFEICGAINENGLNHEYQYGYTFKWAEEGGEGQITSEYLKIKRRKSAI